MSGFCCHWAFAAASVCVLLSCVSLSTAHEHQQHQHQNQNQQQPQLQLQHPHQHDLHQPPQQEQQQATAPVAGDANSEKASVAEQMRKKWSAQDVVRDLEHIKKDLGMLIELQDSGAMSPQELTFYYFRMHDFDNNNLLDGQELMAAMHHTTTVEQSEGHHPSLDELIRLTDSALESDLDHDGYLSYPELRDTMGGKAP